MIKHIFKPIQVEIGLGQTMIEVVVANQVVQDQVAIYICLHETLFRRI